MLWFKAWLETRWGLLFLFGFYLFIWTVASVSSHKTPDNADKPPNRAGPLDVIAFSWIAATVTLAGAGIKTQSGGLHQTKGLHGSTQYTLSLPVSRLRLAVVRSAVGLVETAFLILVLSAVGAYLLSDLITQATFGDMLAYLVVSLICSSSFYFLSMFLGAFFDDSLRIAGSMAILAILVGLDLDNVLPTYLNFFRPMGAGSPLITHTIPWTILGGALVAAAILFVATVKVLQAQEY